ncbi:hypothetical protein [Flavobacterium sp. LAR06]|uniref:hypothetical protein n=1 Tax=Flavobacterium sp. LAR06 TaxID=3064897 RepID=UPI0035C1747C
MKKIFSLYWVVAISLLGQCVFSQSEKEAKELGLPGDNLDLYAVLTLFQKSKTVEEFEKSLNEQKTGINNLDLNLDKKVDFIKIDTKKVGESFTFILNTAVSKTETQDIAVIIVDKDKNGKMTLQIVGDQDLYGKNYVIEPAKTATPSITANPAYKGPEPAAVSAPATTVVIVETVPIVQYVYSPVYVPYYPPYHYGFYPPYFTAFAVMAVGVYRHNTYYHHTAYYGGHYYHGGNTVVIQNNNVYNNYNKTKMKSTTVNHNAASGKYNTASSNQNISRPSSVPTTNKANTTSAKANTTSAKTKQSQASSQAGKVNNGSTTRKVPQSTSRSRAGARR